MNALVIGAGLFGFHSALVLARKGWNVTIAEKSKGPFEFASRINQARVHGGFHYPRSTETALSSVEYMDRFISDFSIAINQNVAHYYGIPHQGSQITADYFDGFVKEFSGSSTRVSGDSRFKSMDVWLVNEPSFDYKSLLHCYQKLLKLEGVVINYGRKVTKLRRGSDGVDVEYIGYPPENYRRVINATYAGLNELLLSSSIPPLDLKHELCEIVLCKAADFSETAVTIMDGPFSSCMPFGNEKLHSLTNVLYTPHLKTDNQALDALPCESKIGGCPIAGCMGCNEKPKSNFIFMQAAISRFVNINLKYERSLFVKKTILKSRDIDDARPTLIKDHFGDGTLISVLSGKVSTIYDLEEIL